METWYYQRDAVEHGPCSTAELRDLLVRGDLAAATLVRSRDSTKWAPAGTVGSLWPRAGGTDPRPSPKFGSPPKSGPPPMGGNRTPGVGYASGEAAMLETPEERDARFKRRVILTSVIVALLLLLLLLLLWLLLGGGVGVGVGSGGGYGTGVGTGNGSGEGPGGGSGRGGGSGAGNGSASGDDVGAGAGGPQAPSTAGTQAESRPPRPPRAASTSTARPLTTELVLEPTKPATAPEEPASSGPSELAGGGRGGGGGGAAEFFGVRVKGRIALVCDISGSMTSDFPILVRQLREKFPKDTPLILVEGCNFMPVGYSAPPAKLIGSMPYMGQEFANDPNTYTCSNTTDAIVFAVEVLKRHTVMFNNDLQDGGSGRAIDDLERLRKKHRFVLSGRSLNCDAPPRLLEFIKSTGGGFKVDLLTRQKSPAVQWGP